MISVYIVVALLGLYGFGLWKISKSRKKNVALKFFSLLYVPILLSIFLTRDLWMASLSNLIGLTFLGGLIAYLIGWGYYLYDSAGEDKLVWFILIFLFSPFWILYLLTELR